MLTTLAVPVSDAVLTHLRSRAAALGTTPEAIAADDLEKAVTALPGFFGKWAGAIQTGATDIAARHDEYIGQGLAEELRDGQSP